MTIIVNTTILIIGMYRPFGLFTYIIIYFKSRATP